MFVGRNNEIPGELRISLVEMEFLQEEFYVGGNQFAVRLLQVTPKLPDITEKVNVPDVRETPIYREGDGNLWARRWYFPDQEMALYE